MHSTMHFERLQKLKNMIFRKPDLFKGLTVENTFLFHLCLSILYEHKFTQKNSDVVE